MKTSELQGSALDWAVALIEFPSPDYEDNDRLVYVHGDDEFHFAPSIYWAQGGPIIERENISVMFSYDLSVWISAIGELWVPEEGGIQGPTPLVAAMRCYVASQLGDDVEIPEGLI